MRSEARLRGAAAARTAVFTPEKTLVRNGVVVATGLVIDFFGITFLPEVYPFPPVFAAPAAGAAVAAAAGPSVCICGTRVKLVKETGETAPGVTAVVELEFEVLVGSQSVVTLQLWQSKLMV